MCRSVTTKILLVTEASWVSLVEHVIWPVTVLVLVLALRRQIGEFLSTVGGRIKQVSVMSVTIELAVATEMVPSWRGTGGEDVRGLVAAQDVNDAYFDTLRQSLWSPGTADFFVVDLKSDGQKEWLTSRLYLFTYMLSRMKGVRSIVFTATRGDMGRSFLGVARTEELLNALAAAEPWLRLARLQVEAGRPPVLIESSQPTSPAVPVAPPAVPVAPPANAPVLQDIDEWWRSMRANLLPTDPLHLSKQFLEHIQWVQPVGAADPEAGWLQLPDAPGQVPDAPGQVNAWEHATWITASDLTDGLLRDAVQPDSYVLDDRSWSADGRVRAVARAPGDFIAVLGPSRRFQRLIDRRSLLEALGAAAVKP